MKRSSSSEEEEEEEFKRLQYDWSSSKKLSPHGSLHQSADAEIIQLMDTSPRELISSLQKFHKTFSSSGWKVRTNHLAVEDVIRERRAVIKSGRLKGRRLFDAFEGRGEMDFQDEEKCSISSSIMIHGSEVRSLCSSLSREDDGDEAEVGDGDDGGGDCELSMEKERVISVEEKGGIVFGIVHRLWWIVRVAWIALAVVVFALLIFSGKSFDRRLDGRRLIPT